MRVEVDDRDETVGTRIRDAELEKIPRVVVYGDRESADVAGRARARWRAVDEVVGRAARRTWYSVSLLKQGHPFLTSRL